ncbi:hypothetical protein J45TS6_31180 [Paenibacillus sp. J45TS6]|nr:hypothetical protein J45TS6_31180 [Paenibacillus sp. J45TS6]
MKLPIKLKIKQMLISQGDQKILDRWEFPYYNFDYYHKYDISNEENFIKPVSLFTENQWLVETDT